MANPINTLLRCFGIEVRRIEPVQYGEFVSLKPQGVAKGNVLLAYIVEPFLLREGEQPSQAHTHHTESLLIAQVFLNLGYNVDVIDYRNESFKPAKPYTFFVSARTNFAALADRLNPDCIKIAHMDTAHFLFNNSAAYRRLLELQQRRGITSTSIKEIEYNYAAEHADYLTVLGNEFTCSTYSYANKPIFPLPVPTPNIYSASPDKDFDRVKNNFLWLGSAGLVHKGLDLVLEVFSGLPDHHLTVCGPLDAPEEREFRQAFYHQLYEMPNIHTVGWVDVSSRQFIDITKSCCALVYPSCSEGQAGSVITCLQASLIPLISYESGVNVEEFGIILTDCSHAEIESAIKRISSKSIQDLEEMSRKAHEYARSNHTEEKYLEDFEKIIVKLGCEPGPG